MQDCTSARVQAVTACGDGDTACVTVPFIVNFQEASATNSEFASSSPQRPRKRLRHAQSSDSVRLTGLLAEPRMERRAVHGSIHCHCHCQRARAELLQVQQELLRWAPGCTMGSPRGSCARAQHLLFRLTAIPSRSCSSLGAASTI